MTRENIGHEEAREKLGISIGSLHNYCVMNVMPPASLIFKMLKLGAFDLAALLPSRPTQLVLPLDGRTIEIRRKPMGHAETLEVEVRSEIASEARP